jgi:oxygen-independent coproporphyrinogen-3 oxidase
MDAMANSLARELELRATSLQGQHIESIYFGGGTPSILSVPQLQMLAESMQRHYTLAPGLEFTIEANPDDLQAEKLKGLKAIGANRLSIGIQSFDEDSLRWMNRAHTAHESLIAVKEARNAGFENLSIDLIYGLPKLTEKKWKAELAQAIALDVYHISAYCLTVETKTALGHRVRNGTEEPVNEDLAAKQFIAMQDMLLQAGYEQYEVSNFVKHGKYSRHNSAYWQGEAYLGIGPSAHSFMAGTRSWNVANNAMYIKAISENTLPVTVDEAGPHDRYNEWVMTGLRTKWGIDLEEADRRFGVPFGKMHAQALSRLLDQGLASISGNILTLTPKGLFMADGIAADFFILEA